MGTNYYLRTPPTNHCECCGRSDPGDELHIGKSSGGWCFSLHVIPERGINTLEDWQREWPKGRIFNEYGEEVDVAKMLDVITNRSWVGHPQTRAFYESNYAEPGPNGLVRHKSPHCVGHGPGTYDYITGDFS